MGKVLGILAVVFAGLGVIIPGGSLLAAFIVPVMIIFAWDEGATMGYVAGGLNMINLAFLSPLMWMAAGSVEQQSEGSGASLMFFYLSIQVIAMALLYYLNSKFGKKA